LSFNRYPVSLPNFSFLPLAVNPIGVTTYWCYILRIIAYNFVTIYGTTTKFDIRMCLYPTFQCTKFQGNGILHLCNFHTLTKRRKIMKKNNYEETKPVFEGSCLGNVWCDLVEMWGDVIGRHFHCKNCLV